ncbi:MAG: hypothetical protein HZA50_09385 [Planctomycetes bacterium]|nr:hypothetical protein [Planctomycetota bacterium]
MKMTDAIAGIVLAAVLTCWSGSWTTARGQNQEQDPQTTTRPGPKVIIKNKVVKVGADGQVQPDPDDTTPQPADPSDNFGGSATLPATQPSTQPSTMPTPKDLESCNKAYMQGYFELAARGYREFMSEPKQQVAASKGLSEALSMLGRYSEAIDALKTVQEAGQGASDWNLAMAQALGNVGQYEKALEHANKAGQLRPAHAQTIMIRGSLLETLGEDDQAIGVYRGIADVLKKDSFKKDAEALVALGQALDREGVLTGKKASDLAQNILDNYFREAFMKVDKDYWPARLATGAFLLAKHRPAEAAKEFQEAMKKVKVSNGLPDACAGLAACELGRMGFEKCLSWTDTALKVNPNHPDSLLLKAACYLQWRKLEEAPPIIQKVLDFNPNHLEALSMMASAWIRMDKPDKAQEFIDRVNKINPRYAGLPTAIGDWLSSGRRFNEAEKHFLKAIEIAPHRSEPLMSLGMLYLQTGEEQKARDALGKAVKIDDFRADAMNYLNLLDKLLDKDIYLVKETPHFTIKVSAKEDAVMLDHLAEHMEAIYPKICGDFDFQMPGRTLIEILPTHQDFSVRLSGRDGVPTVGACTGRVIALAAPSPERSPFGMHDWATVLQHEYTHTVTLDASGNRIPHWFTEGCAVWEQPDRRSWQFVNFLVNATRNDKLFSVKDLDWGFIRPKTQNDRGLAYAQAEWMFEYIVITRDFSVIAKMIKGFRDAKTQPQVFQDILGIAEDQFDKDFRAWAKKQVKEWGFNPEPPPKLQDTSKEIESKPDDAQTMARHAQALVAMRRSSDAKAFIDKALGIDENNKLALAVLAELQFAEKKYDDAIRTAQKLEEVDHETVTVPYILAHCYVGKKSWEQAIAALELLKQRQPMDPWAYQNLANLYSQFGQPDKALPNLIELDRRTTNDPAFAKQIAEIYRGRNEFAPSLDYFRKVTRINPYDPAIYDSIAGIQLKAKQYPQAVHAAKMIPLLLPDVAKSWETLAAVRYKAGKAAKDKDELLLAKKDAQKALELDPACKAKQVLDNADAELQKLGVTASAPANAPATAPADKGDK